MKAALCLFAVSALLTLAAGGGSGESASSGTCADVPLGTFGGQTWSAAEIEGADVPCETAQRVAKQWAAQQVGGPQAELPAGWNCDGNSVCRRRGVASPSLCRSKNERDEAERVHLSRWERGDTRPIAWEVLQPGSR